MTILVSVLAVCGVPLLVLALVSCRTPALGVLGGRLTDCPDRPNCVGSQASDPTARVEPFPYSGDPEGAWSRLVAVVEAHPRTRITERTSDYLRATCRSPLLRFADDLEFLLDREGSRIHVRSASRVGYSDLGVNRKRVAALRAAFEGSAE